MKTLTATCACGQAIESMGTDESSRNWIAAWKTRHSNHCTHCTTDGPPHTASTMCESGGRNHCSCDRCY